MKILFEFLTEPLGLPIDWYLEYIILAAIGAIAYKLAYRFVGDCQLDGVAGHVVHWIARFVIFAALWALTYGTISLIKFSFDNWKTILLITGIVIAAIAIIVLILCVILQIKIHKQKQ